jgi:hypothetical protein
MTLIQTSFSALASGEQVQLRPGDTLWVSVSFKYTVAEAVTVTLRACPYQYKAGVLDRIGGSCGSAEISLEATLTPKTREATVAMPIVPASQGGIADGTYGLIVEIEGTDVEQHIDDCLVITGNPASVWDMIPMMLVVMMMGMIMPMMEE